MSVILIKYKGALLCNLSTTVPHVKCNAFKYKLLLLNTRNLLLHDKYIATCMLQSLAITSLRLNYTSAARLLSEMTPINGGKNDKQLKRNYFSDF